MHVGARLIFLLSLAVSAQVFAQKTVEARPGEWRASDSSCASAAGAWQRLSSPGAKLQRPMQRSGTLLFFLVAGLSHAQEGGEDDLAGAFGPQRALKVFAPERNVPPPPLVEDPNARLRATFEPELETARKTLESGDAAGARDQLAMLELSAFVLGGPDRVRVQHLARAVAVALGDLQALGEIDQKWVAACGPVEVAACRASALDAMATHDKALAEKIRAADACVVAAEKTPGKPAPSCLGSALALFQKADDSLMIARLDLVQALARAADPKQAKAAKKALTRVAESIDGRNGVVRQAAFDARARLELAEGDVDAAAKSALQGAEAWASTLTLERRPWARTVMTDVACAAYDKAHGVDACRQLEKQVVGSYVFHDFSVEHLEDRQLISHEKLVEVNAHFHVLIKDCLAAEIQQLEDRAAVSYLVNWLVISNGQVDNFHSVSSEQDQSRFVRCLREQFGYWRYPSHESDPQRIQQGFSVKSTTRTTEEVE